MTKEMWDELHILMRSNVTAVVPGEPISEELAASFARQDELERAAFASVADRATAAGIAMPTIPPIVAGQAA